jgi:hypothetical protein
LATPRGSHKVNQVPETGSFSKEHALCGDLPHVGNGRFFGGRGVTLWAVVG